LTAPPTDLGIDWYIDAFFKLDSCRSVGMTILPIPWFAMHAYGCSHGLDAAMLIEFERVIRAIDQAYLDDRVETKPKPKVK